MIKVISKSLILFVFLSFAGLNALADVRIIAVNGKLDPLGRFGDIRVRPGEVVSITADDVWMNDAGEYEYGFRPVEDFLWIADDREGDVCDPEQDCRKNSNFEVTEYGINFYVPWNPPSVITITAKLKWGAGSARVRLVTDSSSVQQEVYYKDLEGLGYWVVVGGVRAFVPVVYVVDWAPYRHGYWYWTVYGWTWYSYDPWGYWTDHCGHWRHTILYGWVWIPDPVCVWRPAVVTFYFGPTYIGWYPYDPDWYHGYRKGYEDGFDDGYWMGYHAGNGHHHKTNPGHTAVSYDDFYVPGRKLHLKGPESNGVDIPDISKKVLPPEKARDVFKEAVNKGNVGRVPGGGKDPQSGKDFIAQRTGREVEETKMRPAWDESRNHRWMQPENPPHETPQEYREIARKAREATQRESGTRVERTPVGRVIDEKPKYGIASEPRARGQDRNITSWRPRSKDDFKTTERNPSPRTRPEHSEDNISSRQDSNSSDNRSRERVGDRGMMSSPDRHEKGHPTAFPKHFDLPPEDKVSPLRDRPETERKPIRTEVQIETKPQRNIGGYSTPTPTRNINPNKDSSVIRPNTKSESSANIRQPNSAKPSFGTSTVRTTQGFTSETPKNVTLDRRSTTSHSLSSSSSSSTYIPPKTPSFSVTRPSLSIPSGRGIELNRGRNH